MRRHQRRSRILCIEGGRHLRAEVLLLGGIGPRDGINDGFGHAVQVVAFLAGRSLSLIGLLGASLLLEFDRLGVQIVAEDRILFGLCDHLSHRRFRINGILARNELFSRGEGP